MFFTSSTRHRLCRSGWQMATTIVGHKIIRSPLRVKGGPSREGKRPTRSQGEAAPCPFSAKKRYCSTRARPISARYHSRTKSSAGSSTSASSRLPLLGRERPRIYLSFFYKAEYTMNCNMVWTRCHNHGAQPAQDRSQRSSSTADAICVTWLEATENAKTDKHKNKITTLETTVVFTCRDFQVLPWDQRRVLYSKRTTLRILSLPPPHRATIPDTPPTENSACRLRTAQAIMIVLPGTWYIISFKTIRPAAGDNRPLREVI